MYKQIQSLIFLLIFLPACREEAPLPYLLETTYNCYQDQSWTTATVETAIIGEWERVYFSCFSGEMGEVGPDELTLYLMADRKLEIYRNGLPDRTDTWEIVPRGSENFELKTSQIQPWLKGDIVICDDLLLFFESYIDGCDNYFEKW